MTLTPALQEIVDDFAALADRDRATLLIEMADELPALPEHLQTAAMEPVPECQSPIFLSVDAADPAAVRLYFSAPPEAPTTRGFAGILHEGLDGRTVAEVLGTEDQAPMTFGLAEVVSPLRMRGMVAMLSRIKRQVRLRTSV